MNKFTVMIEHIQARESIGVRISLLGKVWGCLNMLFVPKSDIVAATKNIQAGRVHYDADRNLLIVD